MKSIQELLKRKPHLHQNCHFAYLCEDGTHIKIFNPRNAPMPMKITVEGKKYVITPMQLCNPNYVPKPGDYITRDAQPDELKKIIDLALQEQEEKNGKPLDFNQIKKITKYMRDHTNRYGLLKKIPEPKIVTE